MNQAKSVTFSLDVEHGQVHGAAEGAEMIPSTRTAPARPSREELMSESWIGRTLSDPHMAYGDQHHQDGGHTEPPRSSLYRSPMNIQLLHKELELSKRDNDRLYDRIVELEKEIEAFQNGGLGPQNNIGRTSSFGKVSSSDSITPEKVGELKEVIRSQQAEIVELHGQNKTFRSQLAALNESGVPGSVEELIAEKNHLRKELQDRELKMSQVVGRNRVLDSEIQHLKTSAKEQDVRFDKLLIQINAQSREMDRLRDYTREAEVEKKNSGSGTTQLTHQELESRKRILDVAIREAENTLQTAEKALDAKDAELQRLVDQNNQLLAELHFEKTEKEAALSSAARKGADGVGESSLKIESLLREKRSILEDLKVERAQYLEASRQQKSLQEGLKSLTEEMQKRNRDFQHMIESKDAELQAAKLGLEQMKTAKEFAEMEREDLSRELLSARSLMQNVQTKGEEIGSELQALLEERTKLMQENQALKRDRGQVLSQSLESESSVRSLGEGYHNLEQDEVRTELQKARHVISQLRSELQAQKSDHKQQLEEASRLEETLRVAQATSRRQELAFATMQAENQQLHEQVQSFSEELQTAHKQLLFKAEQVHDLKSNLKERSSAQLELEVYKTEKEAILHNREELVRQINEAHTEISNKTLELSELKSELDFLREHSTHNKEQNDQLKEMIMKKDLLIEELESQRKEAEEKAESFAAMRRASLPEPWASSEFAGIGRRASIATVPTHKRRFDIESLEKASRNLRDRMQSDPRDSL